MVANCKSCPHWWLCTKQRSECELFSIPEEVICDKDELLRIALEDLHYLMIAGTGNMDVCDLCISSECFGRGGRYLCKPKYRGQLKDGGIV